jgi:RNA polymerase sigma-70 factor, ECF subfamily
MTHMPALPEPLTLPVDDATKVATDVQRLIEAGRRDEGADRFGDLVAIWQRRANRLAYYYLGDAADADEAVQDGFVKVYSHIASFRPDLGFDAWFSRILINTCLDRLKSRRRTPQMADPAATDAVASLPSLEPSAERRLMAASTWQRVAAVVRHLPARQRDAFLLCHLHESTPGEAAASLGMHPATFRVHLFRAMRKLRGALGAS